MKRWFTRTSVAALALALTSSLLFAQRPTTRPSSRDKSRTQDAQRQPEGQRDPRRDNERRQAKLAAIHEQRAASEFFKSTVEGKELEANFSKIAKLHWYKTLRGARRAASSSGKPVLWIQAFGDLRGDT